MTDKEPSKTSIKFSKAMGEVKESIGSATSNYKMQADGASQKAKADAEYKAAQTKGYKEGAKDSFVGKVKDKVGSAIGNREMQAEGKASQASGEVKKTANS